MPTSDIIFTLLFALGLFQLCWFSVMFARRGLYASLILRASYPLAGIWVLMWPLYADVRLIFAGITLIAIMVALAILVDRPFFSDLRRAWSEGDGRPWPMIMFAIALGIAAGFMADYPAFGFGAALSLCLAIPFSQWIDKAGFMRLGFAANPQQTLPAHLALVVTIIITCGWSLHVYRQIGWMESLTATALAGFAASVAVALIATPFHMPVMVAAIASVLWLL
jgi:hypothetical protein